MKISYKTLNETGLYFALNSLAQIRMNAKLAYQVSKLYNQVERIYNKSRTAYIELVKKHAELDEKGEIVMSDNGKEPKFRTPESEQAFKNAYEVFSQNEEVITVPKIRLSDLENIQISARELGALDPVLTDISAVEDQVSA